MESGRAPENQGGILKSIAAFVAMVGIFVVLGEIVVRVVTTQIVMPEMEALKYANELVMPTSRQDPPFRHRPNAEADLMGSVVRLDGHGHRNPQSADEKAAGERRIYFLGTSMTFGWGVGQDETFSAVAARLLNGQGAETPAFKNIPINAGVMNYNTAYEVALFRDEVDALKPDIAVLQYYLRDAQAGRRERDPAILRHSMFLAFAYYRLKANFGTDGTTLDEHYKNIHKPEGESWLQTEMALVDLKNICEERGIRLVAVLLPDLRNVSEDSPLGEVYTYVRHKFDALGIPLIDTLPAVRRLVQNKPSAYWVHPSDPHPNAALHSLYGTAIADYIKTLR